MTRKNGIAVLRARIEKELAELRELVSRVENKLPKITEKEPDDFIVAGLASYVHGFYNGLENIFKLIAEYIDNFEPESGRWHKDLLDQMALEISGVRPAVLTDELVDDLKDYLEFRHFFRHSYSFYVEWNELNPKLAKLADTFRKLEEAFQQFFVFLKSVSDQIT
jgi:hypothetical protein